MNEYNITSQKLNLGCGWDYRNGWINTDIDANKKKDLYLNLNDAILPFSDNSMELVRTSHVLEHLSPNANIRRLIDEIYRVLKIGGTWEMNCPHFSGWNAFQMDHLRFYSIYDFLEIDGFRVKEYGLYTHLECSSPKMHTKRAFCSTIYNNMVQYFANLNPKFCDRVWAQASGGFLEMRFKLIKQIKEQKE